jgi:ubiquinol-cytochrome c reductase cytochrome b subunit
MSTVERMAGGLGTWLDDRFGVAKGARKLLRKVFPDHWTFMLGEIASLVVRRDPAQRDLSHPLLQAPHARGRVPRLYVPLQGVQMSEAYASTLDLSFEVRGGLIMRQIHHWAALIFVAAIMIHMLRIFFTGAFRKPRERELADRQVLFILAILEGLFGYSLPDDLLSGTGCAFSRVCCLASPSSAHMPRSSSSGVSSPGNSSSRGCSPSTYC